MGRLSNTEKLRQQREVSMMVERYSNAIVSISKFVVTEGITVATTISVWRITGQVYQYDENGVETPEWAIRSALVDGLRSLRDIMVTKIPLINIAPLAWQEPIVRAYENMLIQMGSDSRGYYFKAVPLVERLEVTILIPALLRTMLELMKGLLSKS